MKTTTILLALLVLTARAPAETLQLEILDDGWVTRVEDRNCETQDHFLCLPESGFYRLGVIGNEGYQGTTDYYCASEDGTVLEFAVEGVDPNQSIDSATLTLSTLAGWEDSPLIGVFAYTPAEGGVPLYREDLSEAAALDALTPPDRVESFTMDVTAGVQAAIAAGDEKIGLLICSLDPLAGITGRSVLFTGMTAAQYDLPIPELSLDFDGVVADHPSAWGDVKTLYR